MYHYIRDFDIFSDSVHFYKCCNKNEHVVKVWFLNYWTFWNSITIWTLQKKIFKVIYQACDPHFSIINILFKFWFLEFLNILINTICVNFWIVLYYLKSVLKWYKLQFSKWETPLFIVNYLNYYNYYSYWKIVMCWI